MSITKLLGLMQNMGVFKQRLKDIQDELGRKTVEAEAGGNAVVATASGQGQLLSLTIDPDVAARAEVALLQDLVKMAVNLALSKARDLQREAMSKALAGVPLPPGLEGLLSK